MINYNKLLRYTVLLGVLIGLILVAGIVRADEIDDLVPYVIICESKSSGNPYAVSKDDCIGLMQISKWVLAEYNQYRKEEGWRQFRPKGNTEYWEYLEIYYTGDLERADLFNARINKTIGIWYLRRIKDHYLPHYDLPPTIRNILIAYNWGIGNLVKWHKKGGKSWKLPEETYNYVKKVMRLYKQ